MFGGISMGRMLHWHENRHESNQVQQLQQHQGCLLAPLGYHFHSRQAMTHAFGEAY